MAPLSIGQTLWFVPNSGDTARMVKVTRVGRLYATLKNGERIRCSDWQALHGRGSCFASKFDHEREIERLQLWQNFVKEVERMRAPAHLSYDEIRNIRTTVRGHDAPQ